MLQMRRLERPQAPPPRWVVGATPLARTMHQRKDQTISHSVHHAESWAFAPSQLAVCAGHVWIGTGLSLQVSSVWRALGRCVHVAGHQSIKKMGGSAVRPRIAHRPTSPFRWATSFEGCCSSCSRWRPCWRPTTYGVAAPTMQAWRSRLSRCRRRPPSRHSRWYRWYRWR